MSSVDSFEEYVLTGSQLMGACGDLDACPPTALFEYDPDFIDEVFETFYDVFKDKKDNDTTCREPLPCTNIPTPHTAHYDSVGGATTRDQKPGAAPPRFKVTVSTIDAVSSSPYNPYPLPTADPLTPLPLTAATTTKKSSIRKRKNGKKNGGSKRKWTVSAPTMKVAPLDCSGYVMGQAVPSFEDNMFKFETAMAATLQRRRKRKHRLLQSRSPVKRKSQEKTKPAHSASPLQQKPHENSPHAKSGGGKPVPKVAIATQEFRDHHHHTTTADTLMPPPMENVKVPRNIQIPTNTGPVFLLPPQVQFYKKYGDTVRPLPFILPKNTSLMPQQQMMIMKMMKDVPNAIHPSLAAPIPPPAIDSASVTLQHRYQPETLSPSSTPHHTPVKKNMEGVAGDDAVVAERPEPPPTQSHGTAQQQQQNKKKQAYRVRGPRIQNAPNSKEAISEIIESSFADMAAMISDGEKERVSARIRLHRKRFDEMRVRAGFLSPNDTRARHLCGGEECRSFIRTLDKEKTLFGCLKYGTIHYCNNATDVKQCHNLQVTNEGIFCAVSGYSKGQAIIASNSNVEYVGNDAWRSAERAAVSDILAYDIVGSSMGGDDNTDEWAGEVLSGLSATKDADTGKGASNGDFGHTMPSTESIESLLNAEDISNMLKKDRNVIQIQKGRHRSNSNKRKRGREDDGGTPHKKQNASFNNPPISRPGRRMRGTHDVVTRYIQDILWDSEPRVEYNVLQETTVRRKYQVEMSRLVRESLVDGRTFPVLSDMTECFYRVVSECDYMVIPEKCLVCETHYINVISNTWSRFEAMKAETESSNSREGAGASCDGWGASATTKQGIFRNFVLGMLYVMADGLKFDGGREMILKDAWLKTILPSNHKVSLFYRKCQDGRRRFYKSKNITKGISLVKETANYDYHRYPPPHLMQLSSAARDQQSADARFRRLVYSHVWKDGMESIQRHIDGHIEAHAAKMGSRAPFK